MAPDVSLNPLMSFFLDFVSALVPISAEQNFREVVFMQADKRLENNLDVNYTFRVDQQTKLKFNKAAKMQGECGSKLLRGYINQYADFASMNMAFFPIIMSTKARNEFVRLAEEKGMDAHQLVHTFIRNFVSQAKRF